MSDKILCIYHGACDDGFAAAWCVRHALGKEAVEFYPGVYQRPPPDVAGRDVVMVDFSYKRPVIEEMASKCSTLLILDHHHTAQQDLTGFPPPLTLNGANFYNPGSMVSHQRENNAPTAVHVLFDMARSGAGIAWDFFHHNQSRPKFIDYVEDRDLWRKLLPGGDEFTIALRSYPQDFGVWDDLFSAVRLGYPDGVDHLIEEGASIQRYYRVQVEALKKEARPCLFMTPTEAVPANIVNAPYAFASEVAGEIIEEGRFGACYFEKADGTWQYSLRSRDHIDVSAVAKAFGGGGHKQAAGFSSKRPVHLPGTAP